jgi:pimeloyl-ACP methyl ester carboxylesterase
MIDLAPVLHAPVSRLRIAAVLVATGLLPAAAAAATSSPAPEMIHLPAAATAEGRPAEIAEEMFGSKGPVVAFVSGMGGDRQAWRTVAERLAPCVRALIYDRPGLGDSSPVPQTPVVANAVADDLAALLKENHLPGPYLLVGHSLGGLYVQSFARNRPQDTAGVVLVDAMTPLAEPGWKVASDLDGTAPRAEEVGIGQSLTELRSGPDFPPVPLVVIVATEHRATAQREERRRKVQAKTAALSPKGKMVIAEHADHFVQLTRPDVVENAVLDMAQNAGADVSACRR